MDRDGAGVELFFLRRGRIKTETFWFKNRLPALRHWPHTHDTVLSEKQLSVVNSMLRLVGEGRS